MQRATMIDRLNNDYSEKFDFLSKERIAKFRRESYARGDVIYAQKFKFIILLRGRAKLNCYENGKEFIFSFVKSGAYVCLDKNTSLEILSDCETLQINISELFELLGDEFASSIINALIKNIYSQRILIKEIVFAKIQTRILNFLNRIANADKIVELPFNIMTLASLLGAPRQNVSSAITKLVNDKKIVKLKGNRIKIL